MSELISGKEALIALANGEEVEFSINNAEWLLCQSSQAVGLFIGDCYKFRLKPRAILINGIEVPAVRFVAHSGGTSVRIACYSIEDAKIINDALRSVFK